MKLYKKEIILDNERNLFNLFNENNLLIANVSGLLNHQNLKNATLLENAPELLIALQDLVNFCKENNVGAELELAENVILKATTL